MTDRPIIFSAPMVRALLDGRKTQTRRVLKPQPVENSAGLWVTDFGKKGWSQIDAESVEDSFRFRNALPYAPGDRLYVREAHAFWADEESARAAQWLEGSDDTCIYRADYNAGSTCEYMGGERWRPSIHMPRWASRLTLSVTDVRVQRLQDISDDDAKSEGAMFHDGRPTGHHGWRHDFSDVYPTAKHSFAALWNSINGPEAWLANPWVVAISFTVHRCNIAEWEDYHG